MANRISKIIREIIQTGTSPAARISKIIRETVQTGGNPSARLTKIVRETIQTGGSPDLRLTQFGIEILFKANSYTDNLNYWLDATSVNLISTGAPPVTISASDSLNNYNDTISVVPQWALTFTDTLNNYNDNIVVRGSGFLSFTDTLNNYSDSFSYATFNTIGFTDNLNNWNDAVSRSTGIFNVALTVSVSDNFTISNWRDGLSTLFRGNQLVLVADDIIDATDRVALSFSSPSVSDTLNNFLDAKTITLGINMMPSTAFDTMQYNWTDLVNVSRPSLFGQEFSDSLNNWNDSVSVRYPSTIDEEDQLSFTDSISIRINTSISVSDGFTLTDSVSLNSFIYVSDTLNNYGDSVNINVQDEHTIYNINDDLGIFWLDDVRISNKDAGLINYYRRYLGDIFRGSH